MYIYMHYIYIGASCTYIFITYICIPSYICMYYVYVCIMYYVYIYYVYICIMFYIFMYYIYIYYVHLVDRKGRIDTQ